MDCYVSFVLVYFLNKMNYGKYNYSQRRRQRHLQRWQQLQQTDLHQQQQHHHPHQMAIIYLIKSTITALTSLLSQHLLRILLPPKRSLYCILNYDKINLDGLY